LTKFHKILILLFLLSHFLTAQNGDGQFYLTDSGEQKKYTVEKITISNGLHSNNIYDVLQDSLGFLWLASSNGLQKYDGYTFTFYSVDQSDSTFETVYGLYEDQRQNLWLQMETGLSRYRRERDDFVRYYFVNSQNDTIEYHVGCIAEDLKGVLWVWIQDSGLYQLDPETKNFIPQQNVNKWFKSIEKQVILKEGSRKGLYETWVTFMPGYYGLKLQYKFAIKRKNGTLEWEPNPNPANSDHGNRELFLTGDTLNLPVVQFNSAMMIDREILPESALKPSYVKFTVDLNNMENPPSEEEQVQLRGDIPPLYWGDEFFVNCIVFDLENKLWIGTDMGLFRFDLETGEYNNFFANPGISGSISSSQITDAVRDRNGDLWFGSSSGLNRFKHNGQTFENYFVDPSDLANPINAVHWLKSDKDGNIWTQSQRDNGGIGCLNKKNKKFTHYSTGFGLWFSSFTIDRSGIAWLGNEFGGLYKLNPKAKKFSTFSIKKNERDILRGNVIFSVFKDQSGEIWIGGQLDGLYRYNRQTKKSAFYEVDSEQKDNPYSNIINCVFQARNGIFWIGTVLGLNRFDPNTRRSELIDPEPGSTADLNRTSHIHEDNHGGLWLLTRNGYLVHFNPNTYEAQFFSVVDNSDLGGQIEFCDLVEDRRGFFWIASGNLGLYKFDLAQKKLSMVEKIGKVNIASIYLDDDGILWCGTVLQGLIRYDTKTDTKSIIREKDGLLSNNIGGVEADQSGNLWLGTQKGLSRYNPQTGTFKHFFKEDGFLTDEFSYQAHAKGKNGELIFGSMHGVVTFHPDSIRDSDYIPPIVLTDFKIQNKPVSIGKDSPLKQNISVSNEIILTHDQNDISITFAALDFSHPERNRYSFYLENFDEDWRKPGLERTAYYTNLDPGEYVFKAKGTNSDGVWNEKGRSIKITVLPPWWKTWWAYSFYTLFFLGLIYSLRRYEMNRIRLRNQVKIEETKRKEHEQIDQMKSTFFANISHEFRTPLTLILGPLTKLAAKNFSEEDKHSLRIMQRNANRLLRLINQLLDFSKLESGKMNLQANKGDIVFFVKGLLMSFQSLAEQKQITYRFTSDRESIEIYFDRDKVEKIITNLISNAFKFTPAHGEITIRIAKNEHNVQISVRDTGQGISSEKLPHIFDRFYQADDSLTRNQEGTGIGLALTKELVELHHGTIEVISKPNQGSEFSISLPIGRGHLTEEQNVVEDFVLSEQPTTPIEHAELVETEQIDDVQKSDSETIVLVVEDNADMRTYIREALHPTYKVVEAFDGVEGIECAQEIIPDLIISDLMMPKKDGYQLCSELKQDEATSHIPIILLTAKAERKDKLAGLELGADDYLVKPFDSQELQIRIKNLIEIRRKLQAAFKDGKVNLREEKLLNPVDQRFMERVMEIITDNLSDERFDVRQFSHEIGISGTQVRRKMNALTGQSPNQFIRSQRLKEAARLIREEQQTVSEAAYLTGFNSLSYFSKCFKEEFGKLPSEY
jgi:signal transduction histidine kinase/ligand-binding sensor domain-containing protein/DNA-binding response OmpR family regulator